MLSKVETLYLNLLPKMRKLTVLAMLCLGACNGRHTPELGVDISPLAEEAPATGKIRGNLAFPSDYIPGDIEVCAETLDGKTRYCDAQKSDESYTLEVPAGFYRVYSYLKREPKERAYYSQFVRCNYHISCPSHEPITVTVEERQTVTDVEPGDWYTNL